MIEWIRNLRVFATLSVIVLHTAAPFVSNFNKYPFEWWVFGNGVDSFMHFGVPVFFMLSGGLMLGRKFEVISFLKTRALKILPPFLFWSIIYIALSVFVKFKNGESFSFFRETIDGLINGSAYHLWFVYSILGLYVAIAVFNKWVLNAKQGVVLFLICWIITITFNTFPLDTLLTSRYNTIINLNVFSGYFGYLVLGYYLINSKHRILNSRKIAVFCFVIGGLYTFFGTHFLSLKANMFQGDLYKYLTLNIALMAFGIFSFFRNTLFNFKGIFNSIIKLIDRYSYGIYLSHVFSFMLIRELGISFEMGPPWYSIGIVSISCLIVSLILVKLVNSLPILNRFSG